MEIKIQEIKDIAYKAGQAVLCIYDDVYESIVKYDGSPLTYADTVSNEIICSHLKMLTPSIPILSEENQIIPYHERREWDYFWCIDPLDGTKEFINKNGEFTINIALIYKNEPILGVVYAPALVTMYWAQKGCGAFVNGNKKLPLKSKKENFTIASSKSHKTLETKKFIEKIDTKKRKTIVSMGSSAKMCCVADGSVDIYPRLGDTMEWDTAAADIIVREAGGSIQQWDTDEPLLYNKENLKNPWFVCKSYFTQYDNIDTKP